MSRHALEKVMDEAEGFVLIGDSSEGRFPAMSYDCYTKTGKRFYCLDLGGLSRSRGPTKGGEVYTRVDDLPDDRGALAIVWVKPRSGVRAVRAAHAAGCTRIWFSFHSAHPGSVLLAQGLGLEIVELGRCPVHYLPRQTTVCRLHTSVTILTGAYQRPPQLDPKARRRELI